MNNLLAVQRGIRVNPLILTKTVLIKKRPGGHLVHISMTRTIIIVLISMLVSSCMATIPKNYSGTDVGYAVIGIGAARYSYYDSYKLLFRHSGEKDQGFFAYHRDPVKRFVAGGKTKYYKSPDEAGVVEVAALQPGHYEVVNFLASEYIPSIHVRSDHDFSIPFEIKPGQIVYLGNYQAANRLKKRDTSASGLHAVFFIIEDRFTRDLELAKERVISLPIENAVDATPS